MISVLESRGWSDDIGNTSNLTVRQQRWNSRTKLNANAVKNAAWPRCTHAPTHHQPYAKSKREREPKNVCIYQPHHTADINSRSPEINTGTEADFWSLGWFTNGFAAGIIIRVMSKMVDLDLFCAHGCCCAFCWKDVIARGRVSKWALWYP